MIYIALLRGINVGGHTIISMAELKTCFEEVGFTEVKTYINSGNVIFQAPKTATTTLANKLEQAITKTFTHEVKVLVKTPEQLAAIAATVPEHIRNGGDDKCNVLFLWPAVDNKAVLEKIPCNDAVETLSYTPGAVVHHVATTNATKSRMNQIVGTPLYAQMTLRNINTVRKLIALTS